MILLTFKPNLPLVEKNSLIFFYFLNLFNFDISKQILTMNLLNKLALKITFLLLILTFESPAQIAISNTDLLSEIKNYTTYVAMKNPESEIAKQYIKVLKANWTFSNKLEFIKYKELDNYLNENSAFLLIGGYSVETTSVTRYSSGLEKVNLRYENTHLYLEYWIPEKKYLEKNKKKFKAKYKQQIARLEIYTDFETLRNPENIFNEDYDGGGHIRNWGLGIFKNHIQLLSASLEKGEERDLYDNYIDNEKIKLLRESTLFVPKYVFTKFNKFTAKENKTHDPKEIFSDYPFPYEVIENKQLNEKILSSEEEFYYLSYIKSSTDKFVSLINSETGEMLYTKYRPASYNLKSKDLKKLAKEIN